LQPRDAPADKGLRTIRRHVSGASTRPKRTTRPRLQRPQALAQLDSPAVSEAERLERDPVETVGIEVRHRRGGGDKAGGATR
jgi:hypothetical protein